MNINIRDANVYIATITPEIAAELLELNIGENRNPKRQKISEYEQLIRSGKWNPYCGDLIRMTEDGYLIDGQNRCHAVINTGIPIDVLFATCFDRGDFAYVDAGTARKGSDVIGERFKKNRNVYAAVLRLLYMVHKHGYSDMAFRTSTRVPNAIINEVSTHVDIEALEKAFVLANRMHIVNGGSTSCYMWFRLVTLDIDPAKSDKLFDALSDELVSDKIISVYRRRVSELRTKRQNISFLVTLNLIAPLWNSCYMDKQLTKIQVKDFSYIPKIEGWFTDAGCGSVGIADWDWLDASERSD